MNKYILFRDNMKKYCDKINYSIWGTDYPINRLHEGYLIKFEHLIVIRIIFCILSFILYPYNNVGI